MCVTLPTTLLRGVLRCPPLRPLLYVKPVHVLVVTEDVLCSERPSHLLDPLSVTLARDLATPQGQQVAPEAADGAVRLEPDEQLRPPSTGEPARGYLHPRLLLGPTRRTEDPAPRRMLLVHLVRLGAQVERSFAVDAKRRRIGVGVDEVSVAQKVGVKPALESFVRKSRIVAVFGRPIDVRGETKSGCGR